MQIKFGTKINTKQKNVTYWVTSDLHFYHKNIMKFHPITRDFADVAEMNERLIAQWNSVVGVNDVVFHLGDFSFGKQVDTLSILHRLNGKIVFILGNHDKVLRDLSMSIKSFDSLELRVNKTKVVMNHYPMTVWNQSGRGSVQLFGHCHGSYTGKGRQLDVGYDANQGTFLKLEDAIATCLAKEIYSPDHH